VQSADAACAVNLTMYCEAKRASRLRVGSLTKYGGHAVEGAERESRYISPFFCQFSNEPEHIVAPEHREPRRRRQRC